MEINLSVVAAIFAIIGMFASAISKDIYLLLFNGFLLIVNVVMFVFL